MMIVEEKEANVNEKKRVKSISKVGLNILLKETFSFYACFLNKFQSWDIISSYVVFKEIHFDLRSLL